MTQRQPGRREGRKAAGDDYVCGKVNVYTLTLTWSPCARSEMQAHLPVTLEKGKNGRVGARKGGRREKKKHALDSGQLLP